ncbi:MAG: hypothetical protein ABI574_13325 [Burkholderiales bacterium]
MSLKYIRSAYGVPARRGVRIEFTGEPGRTQPGEVRAASGAYLRVRFDGDPAMYTLHPTWGVKYLDGAAPRASA